MTRTSRAPARAALLASFSLVAAFGATAAHAREDLAEVNSEVFETEGTASQIIDRAAICAAQHLTAGFIDAPVILSKDAAAGVLVANNATSQASTLITWKLRSQMTIKAKDGRFKIEQSNLQRFTEGGYGMSAGWGPIYKQWGSQWQGAQAAFEASATRMAACIKTPVNDDW